MPKPAELVGWNVSERHYSLECYCGERRGDVSFPTRWQVELFFNARATPTGHCDLGHHRFPMLEVETP
jgi:hypothetical protein